MASLESSMEAHLQLYEIFLTAAKPMALQAAVLLNIPDIIGSQNHLSVEEIASHISASTNKPARIDCLSRIMTLLASIGVFTEETTVDNRGIPQLNYGPTGLSKLLANNEPQQSLAPHLLFLNQKIVTQGYQYLHDAVIDGCQPFTKAHGMSIFEYNSKNSEANRMLNEAMTAQTSSVMASVLKAYDGFKSFKSVVDVGGGAGSAISTIVNEYPHIHGINFDLPHVVRTAPPAKGVEHVEGNMFDQIPSADAVFMKVQWTLHDWDDEHCLKILKNSYDAIPEDGKVLIVDAVIDKEKGTKRQVGLMSDLLMMALSVGGKERTEEEFKNLFYKAGFKSYSIIEIPFYHALIEVSK
ncbi:caffeic acid 3-O-methyltransferase 1-like [Cryptomeria japonica]|uniref:caffeic acid 3-O-methyltransferase 1-like n=1 Tax=Cryptomeria japonica TaxID=3369 RepID=UPI0027DA1752|nr:caffeic acid 3-O-methyltransferase 1-like [Cryptomeria japonica]